MKGEFEWKPSHEIKSLAHLPRVIPEVQPPAQEPPRKSAPCYRYSEAVVNSTHIRWKPIDEVAARVVAPAAWWAEPPQPEPKFMSKNYSVKETPLEQQPQSQIPGQTPQGRIKFKRMLGEDGYVEELVDAKTVAPIAVDKREGDVKDAVSRTEELSKRAQEAYDTVIYLLDHIGEPIEQYESLVKGALVRVREQKMALQNETRGLMSALREVREFFLEDKHEEEVRRLLEFVELCERLKRLKDSGFLDSVADTMLRLS